MLNDFLPGLPLDAGTCRGLKKETSAQHKSEARKLCRGYHSHLFVFNKSSALAALLYCCYHIHFKVNIYIYAKNLDPVFGFVRH